jgi:hypothetical protein
MLWFFNKIGLKNRKINFYNVIKKFGFYHIRLTQNKYFFNRDDFLSDHLLDQLSSFINQRNNIYVTFRLITYFG